MRIGNSLITLIAFTLLSCESMLELEPEDRLSRANFIVNDATAVQALNGLYSSLHVSGNYGVRKLLIPGVMADELVNLNSNLFYEEFSINQVSSQNIFVNELWTAPYQTILRANLLLEIVPDVLAVTPELRQEIIGQAYFLRALMHFDLMRFFGDTPIILNSDINAIQEAPRSSQAEVLTQVVKDLQEAQQTLSLTSQEFASANAVKALLVRVYLNRGESQDLEQAIALASELITSNDYQLEEDYNVIFTGGSSEVIFEVLFTDTNGNRLALESQPGSQFNYAVSPKLREAIEEGDLRAPMYLNQQSGSVSFFANKYPTSSSNPIVLRLAEMYLSRAEAFIRRNQSDDLVSALADINVTRVRAGLPPLSDVTDSARLTELLLQEKFVEFALEGHRFFDLKRLGRATPVLGALKPDTWQESDLLLPLPFNEISLGLSQNPGYN